MLPVGVPVVNGHPVVTSTVMAFVLWTLVVRANSVEASNLKGHVLRAVRVTFLGWQHFLAVCGVLYKAAFLEFCPVKMNYFQVSQQICAASPSTSDASAAVVAASAAAAAATTVAAAASATVLSDVDHESLAAVDHEILAAVDHESQAVVDYESLAAVDHESLAAVDQAVDHES